MGGITWSLIQKLGKALDPCVGSSVTDGGTDAQGFGDSVNPQWELIPQMGYKGTQDIFNNVTRAAGTWQQQDSEGAGLEGEREGQLGVCKF